MAEQEDDQVHSLLADDHKICWQPAYTENEIMNSSYVIEERKRIILDFKDRSDYWTSEDMKIMLCYKGGCRR